MKVIILGGTGFIGSALTRSLVGDGAEVTLVTRNPSFAGRLGAGVRACLWGQELVTALDGSDAVVNLAGENIAQRWTKDVRQRIMRSRVGAGERLMQALQDVRKRPGVLIQGSAVGYYGARHDAVELNEDSPAGAGFLADVCRSWEASTQGAENMGIRRVIIRTGIVLGPGGGVLARMIPAFRWFVGGHPGDGSQTVSWIHIRDQINAIRHLISSAEAYGPYNLAAPNPCTMSVLCQTLGDLLNRPSWLHVPGTLLRFVLGEMAEEMLLAGQRVLPNRLISSKYRFEFADVNTALAQILKRMHD